MFDPRLIEDPRLGVDYQPGAMPLCDGGEAPPIGAPEQIARRKVEFLAVYYRLNRLYSRLSAVRSGSSNDNEQEILNAIKQAIRERDQLEDFYEPEGFLAEPLMDGFYYRSIEFTHARRREYYPGPNSSKVSVFIPLPAQGDDLQSWIRKHLTLALPDMACWGSGVSKP